MTELQEKIIELKKQGTKTRDIAKELGSNKDYINETWRRYRNGDVFITHKNQYSEVSKNQNYWKKRFEDLYPAFEFLYNEGGIEGYNYILCKYCGNAFKRSCENLKPSHKENLQCKHCIGLYKPYLDSEQRKREKKAQRIKKWGEREYYKHLQACMFPKGKRGKQLTMRECIICRQLFVPIHGRQKYCSTSCATYLHWKGKEAYRYKIDLGILYRRDGGICHICGKLCDWNDFTIMEDGSLKVGANYPTRDHLIPKSKGGEHSYENIKLAHLRCNSLKGAKLDTPLG